MINVSFVLPCYNIDRYISECLDSLYAQGLSENEFEVIAVNDCSTDRTRAILEDYSQKHSNLIVIDHSTNLTSGGARNTGIDAAKGEYIWFVDPDDAIVENSVEGLFALAAENNVDVLFFNYYDCDEHLGSRQKNLSFSQSDILPGQAYVEKYFANRFSTFGIIWRGLFKTSFLKESGLRYPIMRKAQDVVFLWEVMLYAQRVCSIEEAYYLYRSNPYSVMKHQLEAHVAFSDRILRGFEISRMITRAKTSISPMVLKDMKKAIRWCANSNLEMLTQMSKVERLNYYAEIQDHPEAIALLRPYMNRKSKLLFDTSFGRLYWLCKANLLCIREQKRNRG